MEPNLSHLHTRGPCVGRTFRPGAVLFFLAVLVAGPLSCDSSSPSGPGEAEDVTITILYTNDEHGWIEEGPETDGAAKLLGLWRSSEGYEEGGSVLIVSGGDNWTGPAISTWFQGESTVEVMNAMGYTASTIGNHEFDFTLAGLEDRIDQADFPFLSANIREKGSGGVPSFATPFVIRDVAGLRVGLVGLTTTSTPWTAFPTYVENLDFFSYQDALTEWVPRVWDAGADMVLVLGHICKGEMEALAPLAGSLGISMLGGGHCNQRVAEVRDGVALVQGGWRMEAYGKVEVVFDPDSEEVVDLRVSTVTNAGGTSDAAVAAVVSKWQAAAAQELSAVIGFADAEIPRTSALHNLITDSWLFVWPSADIVMTNAGGVRQGVPAGEITRGTIVGVLPFQNYLVELELTGGEVVSSVSGDIILAGMTTVGGYFHTDGSPLKMDSVYNVLTTDYLYARNDYSFSVFDPEPYLTGLNYHQPTVLFLESLGTAPGDPLNDYLDPVARR